ncbi:TonB-dependent receptor [Sphingomonas oligophenolica]|uniref:TonB-dependent receptor n=1 Tax=Sphingomonas oligophenolica TaxID=301154 RepID=A0ABU9XZN3_9SPHN
MKTRDLMLGASASALILASLSMATPAWAQDAGATSSDDATADKPAKAKNKSDDVATDIIVTARRKALADAISIKKNSDTIVDSVTADEAGKLPDNSITEVLQRVPGVSISRFVQGNGGNTAFQIEGTGITVRGLPFNSSMLNGQQLFSANGASAISWNEVTPELMAGVDVYKATRADIIEGGASSIDLRTHLPFDFHDTQFNVTAGGSYGTMAKKASPRISAMFSKRFDTGIGEIGVLWDFAFSRLYQQSSDLAVGAMFAQYVPTAKRADHLAFVPSSFNWSTNQNKRDRYGAYQAIQWKPASNLTLTNTIFYSQYRENSQGTSGSLGANPSAIGEVMPKVGTPVVYDPNGGFQKGTLTIGSTGNAVLYSNTSVGLHDSTGWFPLSAEIDCGATYGGPVSSIQWDWSFSGPQTCTPPNSALNPSGGSSISHSKNSTLDISQSFVWTPGDRVSLRGGVQYVSSSSTGQSMSAGLVQNSPLVSSMDVDLTGSLPAVSGIPTAGLLDKSTSYLAYFGYHEPKNKGTMLAGHIDLEYRVSDGGFLRSIAVGARAAKRTEKDNFVGTYWAPLSQSWLGKPSGPEWAAAGPGNIQYLNNPNVWPADYQVSTFSNFFGGQVAVPAQLFVPSQHLMESYDWYHLLKTYNGQIPNGTPAQYWAANIDQGLNKTDSRITNWAAYVETRFAHDRIGFIPAFSGNIGVRVFHDSLQAEALESTPNASNLALTAEDSYAYYLKQNNLPNAPAVYPTLYGFTQAYFSQSRDYQYTRVLPSFNIKFDASDKFKIRGAASLSSAPPNLNDIRPGGSIGTRSVANPLNSNANQILTGVVVNGGGADLKPTMITSEDVSFEYYPSSSSFFYLDLFAKQIKNEPLFYSFIKGILPTPLKAYANGATPPPAGTTTSNPDITDVTLNLPWLYLQNKSSTETARIKGFEIGGRKFFDKLPGVLRGLGIDANLTYIDSKNPAQQANNVLTPPPAGGQLPGLNPDGTVPQTYPNLPYAGLSKWAYNVQLLYSRGKVNFRLAYNWRDKALLSTNVNPLSYATSGGNPYTLNTSPTNFDSAHSWPVYNMVPAYMAAAGYLDLGFDYKVSERVSVSFNANNLLNTISRTLQEPVPGVFEPYDYNVSDRRFELTMRMRF